jgi:hypothetical protein
MKVKGSSTPHHLHFLNSPRKRKKLHTPPFPSLSQLPKKEKKTPHPTISFTFSTPQERERSSTPHTTTWQQLHFLVEKLRFIFPPTSGGQFQGILWATRGKGKVISH